MNELKLDEKTGGQDKLDASIDAGSNYYSLDFPFLSKFALFFKLLFFQCCCCKPRDRLVRLYMRAQEKYEREISIEKIVKTIKTLKIFIKHKLMTEADRPIIERHKTNLVYVDTTEDEEPEVMNREDNRDETVPSALASES